MLTVQPGKVFDLGTAGKTIGEDSPVGGCLRLRQDSLTGNGFRDFVVAFFHAEVPGQSTAARGDFQVVTS